MSDSSQNHQKTRVGVIFGGRSSENEVSLATGRYILNLIDSIRFKSIPLYMDQSGKLWIIPPKLVIMNTVVDIEAQLETLGQRVRYEELVDQIDFAFIALLGKFGEDGAIQGLLTLLGIPFSGAPILTSAVCMHKGAHKEFLRSSGVTVTKDIHLFRHEYLAQGGGSSLFEQVQRELGLPAIVKPVAEGSSVGVSCVRTADELEAAVSEAFNWDHEILIEEFIEGQEFMCLVIGNETPTAMNPSEVEFSGDIFTYEAKYMPGQAIYHTPIRTSLENIQRIKETAERIYRLLGIRGYGRVDGFLKDDTIYISEPHTGTIMVPSSYVFQQASIQKLDETDALKGFKGKHGGSTLNPRTLISSFIDLGFQYPASLDLSSNFSNVANS